jgi:DNA-binding transcriptional regulator YdaS (Cro superfamily)
MELRELITAAELIAGGTRKLAAVLGESPSNISKWRSGARHCPDEKIVRMAQIAGMPPKETLGEVAWRRLGKLATTSALGAVAMLLGFGIAGRDAHAAGARLSEHYVYYVNLDGELA